MDFWSNLWQNLLYNGIWWLLLFGGTTLLTWLRVKRPQYASVVSYAFTVAACIAALIFTATGRPWLSTPVTPDNVEEHVRAWSDNRGVSITKEVPEANMYFKYGVTVNGTRVDVFRVHEKPEYLMFDVGLSFSATDNAVLAQLSNQQMDILTQKIVLELLRNNVGLFLNAAPNGPNAHVVWHTILMTKTVPITSDMTEASFGNAIDTMTRATGTFQSTMLLALADLGRPELMQLLHR